MATHEIRNTAARDGDCGRQRGKDCAQEKESFSPPHAAGLPVSDPVSLRSSLPFRDGNERDFSEAIALLKACKESILNIYSRRSPIDRGTLAAMMTATTWMDAGAALAQGFIDGVADPQTCPADSAAVRTVNRKDAEAKVQLWLERCHSRKQENAAVLPAVAQCETPAFPQISCAGGWI